jgi:hypothetical protein
MVKGEWIKTIARAGGVVADNGKTFTYEMRDFLDYARNSGKYKSEHLDTGCDGVEMSMKL